MGKNAGNRKRVFAVLLAFVFLLSGCRDKTEIREYAEQTALYLQEMVPEPGCGSVGGEWVVIPLARSGLESPDGYLEGYYERVCRTVAEKNGVLSERKNTEYSRVILALAAIGKDPTDVSGYDLTAPLADYDKTVSQGINGAIWALIALNACDCEPPEAEAGTQGNRKAYLEAVLEGQSEDGGWGLVTGVSDVDITAMALQALAPYSETGSVAQKIEEGLQWLSEAQLDSGGFYSYGAENLESTAQVVIALYELGLTVEDERFVKDGGSLWDAMQGFAEENGGFSHVKNTGENQMATEQAFLAMTEMLRYENGESPLYQF